MTMILIGKCVSKRNRIVLRHDNDLADHFIRFLSRHGKHAGCLCRQRIMRPAFDQFCDLCIIFCLAPLIAGTAFVISIVEHDSRITGHCISQIKPFCFQEDRCRSLRRSCFKKQYQPPRLSSRGGFGSPVRDDHGQKARDGAGVIANGMGMAVGAEFRVADVQFAALAVLGDGGRTL